MPSCPVVWILLLLGLLLHNVNISGWFFHRPHHSSHGHGRYRRPLFLPLWSHHPYHKSYKYPILFFPNFSPSRHELSCKTGDGRMGRCTFYHKCRHHEDNQTLSPCPGHMGFICCPPNTLKNIPIKEPDVGIPENKSDEKKVEGKRGSLDEKNCGTMAHAQVVGGITAEVDEFPWLALLYYNLPEGVMPACGGSLITQRYVLTAAHCIKQELSHVVLGEFNTSSPVDVYHGVQADSVQVFQINETVVHESYVSDSPYAGDIALIRMDGEAVISRFVRTICLPLDDLTTKIFTDRRIEVAGWGSTNNDDHEMSATKQHVVLRILDNQECRVLYGGVLVDFRSELSLSDYGMICTLGEEGKDSCTGDSGGPVMLVENPRGIGQWHIIGVISSGPEECGSKDKPAFNVRVTDYLDWILDNIKL